MKMKLQTTGSDFFFCDFALTPLENRHQFFNFCNNFQLNATWHRQSMAALIFCWRLAKVTSLSSHQSRV